MSKDFNDILKEINKQNKDLENIKLNIKELNNKIDLILEILNNFTLMVFEDEENEENLLDESSEYEFDTDQTWVPEEEEDDEWNSKEDDS